MAEWRERGYVPDSDEEEEETHGRPRQVVGTRQEVQRQSSQSELPVIREGQDDLQPARSLRYEVLTSVIATNNTDGLIEANTPPPPLKDLKASLPLPALDADELSRNHDVDHMEVDSPLPSSPVAQKLQATLSHGLKQVSEILRSPESQGKHIQNGSQSSSPLSSLDSLEHELSKYDRVEELPARSQARPTKHRTGPSPQQSPELFAPQRALRQRTQIQLHPYALEDARYQRALKARGLKPVRIAASQSQQPRNLLQAAGDEASLFSSSPVDSDYASMHATGSTQDGMLYDLESVQNEEFDHSVSALGAGDDDEDLPDLATMFRPGTAGTRPLKSKSFRAAHTYGPGLDEQRKMVDVFGLPGDEEVTRNTSSGRAAFFVPPSPPHSESASAPDKANDTTQTQEQKQKATPGRLPTPLLSSEIPSRKRLAVELSDSSQDLSDGSASANYVSSEEEDDEKVGRIKAMKRRIKGVLPASWLKLDLKQQTLREEYPKDLQLARELIGGKGVAKPKPAARPHTAVAVPSSIPRRDALQLDFSEEDSSADEGTGFDRAVYRDIDTSVSDCRSTDVLEDNRIDTMQPTRERRPKFASKPRKKRQQRISDTLQNFRGQSDQQITFDRSHSTRKKRLYKASNAKRQQQHRSAPRLTVLDAPGFVQSSTADRPQFLKVASRRAHKETEKAVQSPGGKFLRLATDRDTRDINYSLERWQDGHIRPHITHHAIVSKIGPAANRRSLPQDSTSTLDTGDLDNPFWATSSAAGVLNALRNSTDATVQRIIFKQRGLPVRSRREAASTTSTSHAPASLAKLRTSINLRKPLQNRAGLGSLQKAVTHPRFAQLEHTMPVHPSANLSRPLASANSTNGRNIDKASTIQTFTSVTQLDEQLATASLQPVQQTPGSPVLQRTRKDKAPQRTQLVTLTEARRSSLTAGLPVVQDFDRTSDESNIVTDIMTTLGREDCSGAANDGWSILWPPLQKWLEVYSYKESIRTPSEKKQAKGIFRWCRKLVLEHRWPTAWDDLIRKAAWFFSTFGMVDPFDSQINPHIGLPPFLDEMTSTVGLALSAAGDSTFYIFLDMLTIALTQKSTDVTIATEGLAIDKRKKTELQSFVNRLYPNNGRLLSEGEEIRKVHLASLWNRCSLYLTLYCYTIEDCRPRLSQFQNLVDFSQSHIKACEVILAVWGVLACFHAKKTEASQYRRLADISDWMQSMLLRMLLKWLDARKEVEKQLQGRAIEGHAMYVVHTNQSSVESFLRGALDTWTMAIETCESQSTAVQLLGGQQLEEVLNSLIDIFVDNDTLLQHTLCVIDQYLHRYSTADLTPNSSAHHLLLIIFRTIDIILSQRFRSEMVAEECGLTRVINRRLTYDWCLVASALIMAKERAWEDFLEPAGKCSWERFSDAKRSAQYQTLFISHIITVSEDVYRDNKFWYLSYWIRALLRPSNEFVFEHELSNAVLKADQYEPVLMSLPFLLQSGSGGYEMTLAELKHNRTNILERIIEGIAAASTTYDSQMVDPYALQPPEMADLLRLMMNTMRITRSSLTHGSEERNEYEIMVCKMAEKMDRYTTSIVPLDRWLTEAEVMAFSRYNLRKRFGGALPAIGTIVIPKQEVMWFQHTCQKAAIQGTQGQICEVLHKVYVDASDVFETRWYQPKMLAMMQQVFPAYLELALTDKGALMGAPVLRSLDSICSNIFMRAINMEAEDHSQLLDALYVTIASAQISMQRSNVDRDIASIMTFETSTLEDQLLMAPEPAGTRALAFSYVVRIARIAISQYQQVVRCAYLPQSELDRIASHARYIFVFVRALWLCLQDGQEGHWSESDEVDWHHFSDSETNKVKQFAAEALEKGLRLDWSSDPAGNWWVMQGRGAVQVKREPTAGIADPRLRKLVKDEMQAYMDMYEGTTGRALVEALMGDAVEPGLRNMREEA